MNKPSSVAAAEQVRVLVTVAVVVQIALVVAASGVDQALFLGSDVWRTRSLSTLHNFI